MLSLKKTVGLIVADCSVIVGYNIFVWADKLITEYIPDRMSFSVLIVKNNVFDVLAALMVPCLYVLLSIIIDSNMLKKVMVINVPVLIAASYAVYILMSDLMPIGGGTYLLYLFFAVVTSLSNIIICFASKDS